MLAGCGRLGFDAHIVPLEGDAAVPAAGDGDGNGDGDGDAQAQDDAGAPDPGSAGDGDAGASEPFVDDDSGAATGDPQDDGGGLARTCSDYLVCSGFEGTPEETAYDSKSDILAVIATGNEQVHSGALAMRAATVQENDQATVEFTVPAVRTGDLYARAWMFAPLGTLTGRINVLYLGSSANDGGVDVNINGNGALDLYFREHDVRNVSAASVVPQTRWFCLQIHMTLDDDAGDVEAWVDGTRVAGGNGAQDTIPLGGVTTYMTGINWTEAGQSTTTLFVDDVALDTAPVPCE
jgi:hypothetical protein